MADKDIIIGEFGEGRTMKRMFIAPNEPALNEVLNNRPFGEVTNFPHERVRKLNISGKIEIDCETGKVELINCTLDEAAETFWRAVEDLFPGAIPKRLQ